MANILTGDVHTYVRELISKEFGSAGSEDNADSENRESINREPQNQQEQTTAFDQNRGPARHKEPFG